MSIERELAAESGIGLGDRVTFDIAGQLLAARVTSVRTVEWNDSQNGGFVFVLRPAPARRAGRAQLRRDSSRSWTIRRRAGRLQRDLVKSHPNVSVIDVRDVMASIRDVVDNVTLGVTVVGAVTLLAGALMLIGAVAMTKFQRLYEAAIYRTLGAGTRLVAAMVAVEYGILGVLAGVLGAVGAVGLSWVAGEVSVRNRVAAGVYAVVSWRRRDGRPRRGRRRPGEHRHAPQKAAGHAAQRVTAAGSLPPSLDWFDKMPRIVCGRRRHPYHV